MSNSKEKSVFILSLSSDIGHQLALRYLNAGFKVSGTYRKREYVEDLIGRCLLVPCDICKKVDVEQLEFACKEANLSWNIFISCVGQLDPIGSFFTCDFDKWQESVQINMLGQLRALHALYPLRAPTGEKHVIFFAGAGTNNPATNYSAYCCSKISLIKMCELLDDENPDLNFTIIGPGIVRTKIHQQTIASYVRDENYENVASFLKSDMPGTSHDEIHECINWCIESGRNIVGGRNISLVYDEWRENAKALKWKLLNDKNMYKLRRYRNVG